MVRRRGMFSPSPYTTGTQKLGTQEELRLIAIYQESGDPMVAEQILKSRGGWVQSVISNLPLPGFVDMDSAFSDVMIAVYEALTTFDPAKASFGAYLWRVVYNAALTSVKEQDPQAEQFTPDLVLDEAIDYSECIENARFVILNAPHDMLNERARKVAHMMLKGYGTQEIASSLSITKSLADEIIAGMRRYIAWCMVNQNLSAEPLISDMELMELAEAYERSTVTCWR